MKGGGGVSPMETADKHRVNFNTVGLGMSVNTLAVQEKK